MKHQVVTSWKSEMSFDAEVSGHIIKLDASPEAGGKNEGARPKELLLASLGGCTGMDVISILRKMKIEPEEFNIKVEGILTDEHPKYYSSMHIIYEFKGQNLDLDKIEKAISLSQERYCGVSALFRKGIEITHEVRFI